MDQDKEFIIRLNRIDLGQVIDGLEVRARAWRDTANYLHTGELPHPDFVVEVCRDVEEAERLAEWYERIIASILTQQHSQH
ncbi:MAG TPA: hypothetical protein PKD45_00140 [Flavobacteriales bacterium]|nr:hypothetical protein [Flavobacteriales bacterium]